MFKKIHNLLELSYKSNYINAIIWDFVLFSSLLIVDKTFCSCQVKITPTRKFIILE